eukprot:gnl/Hemi2/25054_TR8430_c0_g1_i1.p1 gnl/Hemi2/25054_TR8430_c0_g1~~gnl/Hemi2/25054_TR8430_c0_g1_i1.p1  ORF type:complete len:352 (-),score=46.42 gnl/Hemi2/25054_TR8430_c0_g1_i1:82-1137(-)
MSGVAPPRSFARSSSAPRQRPADNGNSGFFANPGQKTGEWAGWQSKRHAPKADSVGDIFRHHATPPPPSADDRTIRRRVINPINPIADVPPSSSEMAFEYGNVENSRKRSVVAPQSDVPNKEWSTQRTKYVPPPEVTDREFSGGVKRLPAPVPAENPPTSRVKPLPPPAIPETYHFGESPNNHNSRRMISAATPKEKSQHVKLFSDKLDHKTCLHSNFVGVQHVPATHASPDPQHTPSAASNAPYYSADHETPAAGRIQSVPRPFTATLGGRKRVQGISAGTTQSSVPPWGTEAETYGTAPPVPVIKRGTSHPKDIDVGDPMSLPPAGRSSAKANSAGNVIWYPSVLKGNF